MPVKNNDEVIAFFTTDIVKETRQPIMQVGHKEGYLTKRGKNFGGWKRRYFVLQGPVLEYYDNVRSAHEFAPAFIEGTFTARRQPPRIHFDHWCTDWAPTAHRENSGDG